MPNCLILFRERAATWMTMCLCIAAAPMAARADVLVHADGRRESVEQVARDSKGRWTRADAGRRVVIRSGEVALVVDTNGKEWVTIPDLVEGPETPAETAALASLVEPRNEAWLIALECLTGSPTRGMHDKLVALAMGSNRELQLRGAVGLTQLRTKESVLTAARAILAQVDPGARRKSASAMPQVREILRRCEGAPEIFAAGLKDKDGSVRFSFAESSLHGTEGAIEVLIADGLKASDHHLREEAATELARRGNDSGVPLLAQMLARKSMPGVDDEDLMRRLLTQEQVEICGLLGQLDVPLARAALEKALKSRLEPVRHAAEAALAQKDA